MKTLKIKDIKPWLIIEYIEILWFWPKRYLWISKRDHKTIDIRCNCGVTKNILITVFNRLKIKSCWCKSIITKHWMWNTRFYRIYWWIKQRCNAKYHPYYKYYWWRWIKNTWIKFEDFKKDMYLSYLKHVEDFWEKETTIDRKENSWNYCKNNCRWATLKEQANNKR